MFRVAVAYLLAAWVLLQAIDFILDAISAPNWILPVFILAAVVVLLAERVWDRGGENGSAVGGRLAADSPAKDTTSQKSIAVLPVADLNQAGDQECLAEGLAEEILNTLAKTPDLLVASCTSSFRYKKSELDLPNIAAELNVAHILEGSVRSSGNRIRVIARLIRARRVPKGAGGMLRALLLVLTPQTLLHVQHAGIF